MRSYDNFNYVFRYHRYRHSCLFGYESNGGSIMIINNWRGYDVNIKHRSEKYCRIELFNNNKQHFINVYSLNPNGLKASEINKNIYQSIRKDGAKW